MRGMHSVKVAGALNKMTVAPTALFSDFKVSLSNYQL